MKEMLNPTICLWHNAFGLIADEKWNSPMKWSQLKKRIEDNFAESVKGRVEIWATRYRKAHDQEGELWITIDKERVLSMGSLKYQKELYETATRLQNERSCKDHQASEQRDSYRQTHADAERMLSENEIYDPLDFLQILHRFLTMGIDEALTSPDPLVRALAVLDRRCGKRRLKTSNPSGESSFVAKLYLFRCQAEAIEPSQEPGSIEGTLGF